MSKFIFKNKPNGLERLKMLFIYCLIILNLSKPSWKEEKVFGWFIIYFMGLHLQEIQILTVNGIFNLVTLSIDQSCVFSTPSQTRASLSIQNAFNSGSLVTLNSDPDSQFSHEHLFLKYSQPSNTPLFGVRCFWYWCLNIVYSVLFILFVTVKGWKCL